MAAGLIALNEGQWNMKLMSAKQHYTALNRDPERGTWSRGESDPSSTSCMRDAGATEKDEKEAGMGMATLELFVDERNEGVTLQKLNRHHDKALILGDINIDLNSDKILSV